MGRVLFGSFLDVKYYWMGYFLLALQAHHIMAGMFLVQNQDIICSLMIQLMRSLMMIDVSCGNRRYRSYGDNIKDVQMWKFQSLVNEHVIISHLWTFWCFHCNLDIVRALTKGVFSFVLQHLWMII